MIKQNNLTANSSDAYGALASGLCLIHCLATPFIFLTQTSIKRCSHVGPFWWRIIDFLFLGIAFLAIYKSSKTTQVKWMPTAMYACFLILSFLVFNEKIGWIPLPCAMVYLPAVSLIILHLYNIRFCNCRVA